MSADEPARQQAVRDYDTARRDPRLADQTIRVDIGVVGLRRADRERRCISQRLALDLPGAPTAKLRY